MDKFDRMTARGHAGGECLDRERQRYGDCSFPPIRPVIDLFSRADLFVQMIAKHMSQVVAAHNKL